MILAGEAQKLEDVRRHYDDLDWIYRDIWGEHVHHGYWRQGQETQQAAVEALIDLVAGRLELRPGLTVCDIGCGYGATAKYLAQHYGVAVTGLTISQAQAHIASELEPTAGSFTCLQRDWLCSSLPDHSFDRAYAIESTEHMSDKRTFFSEAWRTLRPEGRLVVCAWLAGNDPSRFAIRHLLEPICREGRLPSIGSRADYEQMAQDAGFSLTGFDDLSSNVRRTWSICARRLLLKFAIDRRYRALIVDPKFRERIFLLSIPRLMIALRTGAMRYGIFTWVRRD